MDVTAVSFGDNVQIRETQVTRELGLAGLQGVIYGVTMPSFSKVAFVGDLDADHAVNVYFEDRGEGMWFAPDLVEFVDHGAGMEASIDGLDKKWVKRADGGWDERPATPTTKPTEAGD